MFKIDMEVHMKFSGSFPKEGEEFIKSYIDNANNNLFRKGIPQDQLSEGAKIISWEIRNDSLYLHIVSGTRLRAHVAILRFKNNLIKDLGKKYHIGLRNIEIDRLFVEFDLDTEPIEPVSIPFSKSLQIDGKHVKLEIEGIDEEGLRKNYVDRIIRRLSDKVRAQSIKGKAAYSKTIRRSNPKLEKYALDKDPTRDMLKLGWIKEFPAAGVWQILPPYAALLRAIEQLVIDKIVKPAGFIEVFLPRLIPIEVQMKKGHLAIPYELFWVSPPMSRNPKDFEDYIDMVEITGSPQEELLRKKLKAPAYGLAYAQCEPFYEIFSGEKMDIDKFIENPIRYFDRNGPTWRYEGGGLKGIERLNEFHRLEFVYLSSPEKVIEIRDKLLDLAENVIDKIFDLEYRIDATTAVYLEHSGTVESDSSEFVKTYDLTALLPFKTISRPEAELEIASFHVHTDFYANRFHFKDKNKRTVWTGCTGIGPSRWAYVFLIRYGFDFDNWPKEIRKYIGEKLPEPLKLLTWPKK